LYYNIELCRKCEENAKLKEKIISNKPSYVLHILLV